MPAPGDKMNHNSKVVVHTTVFPDGPDGGNPCPVIVDGNDINSQQGCALAKQFGAETIVIGQPESTESVCSLRYFVPQYEMEMCIHGTIAAITVLAQQERITTSPVKIDTALGPISVEWQGDENDLLVTVYQFPPKFAQNNPSIDEVASVLRLSSSAFNMVSGPIQSVSTSRYKLIVPLASEKILDELEPDFEALWGLCDKYETTGLYPFSTESGIYSARQFPRRAGYNEDPATGVAACALGAYLAKYNEMPDGWQQFQIRQGYAMKKPSQITSGILLKNQKIIEACVSGQAIILRESVEKIPKTG